MPRKTKGITKAELAKQIADRYSLRLGWDVRSKRWYSYNLDIYCNSRYGLYWYCELSNDNVWVKKRREDICEDICRVVMSEIFMPHLKYSPGFFAPRFLTGTVQLLKFHLAGELENGVFVKWRD